MLRKILLKTKIIIFSLLTTGLISITFFANQIPKVDAQSVVIDITPVVLVGFVSQDTVSTIDVNPNINEVGIYSDVVVRVVDQNNNPLANHTVVVYVVGNPAGTNVIQSADPTDSDGYAIAKVRSTVQGSFTIKAYDSTYQNVGNIDILDTDTFTVFPIPTPDINSEPYYTKGTTNRIYWGLPDGLSSYSYYVEASTNADFSTIYANSGWVNTQSFEFPSLQPDTLYYFRVKAKNVGGSESGWSTTVFSTQDNNPPVISYVDIQRVITNNIFTGINIQFDVTDNFEVGDVKLYCKLQDGTLDDCGTIEKSGARYYVNIPISELERGGFGAYFDNYNFCVQAYDKAGNFKQNCDFNIKVAEFVQTPIPLFTNLINSIIKYVNDNLKLVGDQFTNSLIASQEFALQFITLIIYSIVVISSLSILAQGLLLIPSFTVFQILKIFRYIGFVKKGRALGVVYDAITGRPVKYVKVSIFDAKNRLIKSDVTDRSGTFYGDIDLGKYRLSLQRAHYLYPSELYKEYGVQKYGKLYRGEYVIINKKNPMNLAIPIDPINIYSEYEKNVDLEKKMIGLLKALVALFIAIGLAVAVLTFEKYQNILNLIFLLMYIPVIGIYLKSVIKLKV